jgi:hypothetical protein
MRWIWLTLSLVLCVFGGGLYFAVSRHPFLCPISTQEDSWQDRLRFWFNYKFIASGLARATQTSNEDMSEWEHVEASYVEGIRTWWCVVSMKSSSKKGPIFILVPPDGEPELHKHRLFKPLIIMR